MLMLGAWLQWQIRALRKGSLQDLGLESIWEFPKIRGTFFWGPYKKDPSI